MLQCTGLRSLYKPLAVALKTLHEPFLESTSLRRQQHTPKQNSMRGTECLYIREP